jgi:hypothetical protein
MLVRTLPLKTPLTARNWGTDGAARFFRIPANPDVSLVAESSVSGCAEVTYQSQSYK